MIIVTQKGKSAVGWPHFFWFLSDDSMVFYVTM